MTPNHQEVIAKIRKLYALARCTTEGEAKAAIAAADRLIQEYRIAQADIGEKPRITMGEQPVYSGLSMAVWRKLVLLACCRRYGCAPMSDADGYVMIWGTEEDQAVTRLQFERATAQIETLAVRACKGKGRSFADSYRKGCAVAVAYMLKDQALPAASTAALVVISNRYHEATEAMQRGVPGLSIRRHRPATVNHEAFEAGKRDGRHIHIGESLGGAPKGALGSGQ